MLTTAIRTAKKAAIPLSLTLCACTTSHANDATSLASIVPRTNALGAGWRSEIEVLIDPTGAPSEIVTGDQISERWLEEWRRQARNTNNALSGWARAHFDYVSQGATNRYYLTVELFRTREAMLDRFARLQAPDAVQQHSFPRGLGEAAVVEHDKGTLILWFRRGLFLVGVSSAGGTPAGEPGGTMRQLAQAADTNILAAEPTPKHSPDIRQLSPSARGHPSV